jgi:hypothetical protein
MLGVNSIVVIHISDLGGPALKRTDLVAMAPLLQADLSSGFTAGCRVIHIINTGCNNARSDLTIAVVITASWLVDPPTRVNKLYPHLYQLQVVPWSGPKEEIECHWSN